MQKQVSDFIAKYSLETNETIRYLDLISEIGELGKEIIKGSDYGRKEYAQAPGAIDEIGDCIFSLLALCSAMNVDTEEALRGALLKYETRFARKGSIDSGQ